ncbi:MAG: nitrile hydratase subunit beta [Pseudomonadota bacterium]
MSDHHDLGGKDFGPIDVTHDDPAFHHEYEGIAWAISRSARAPAITIDWWRHCREMIGKEDYLSRPYFDSWIQTDIATYIDGGALTLEELLSGAAQPVTDPPPKTDKDAVLKLNQQANRDFSVAMNTPPKFKIGDMITTKAPRGIGHTRLPNYARGKPGVIHAYHGGHLYPDVGALGKHQGEHLYTVCFDASALWGTEARAGDKVYLDLWEPYFD